MDEDQPSSSMIKLISAEGHEFFVNRKCAMVSGTIKAMLSGKFNLAATAINTAGLNIITIGQFAESSGEVRFPEIPALILEKVIQYLYYKVRLPRFDGLPSHANID
jgi:elongin-C